jgi:hypothetical protein
MTHSFSDEIRRAAGRSVPVPEPEELPLGHLGLGRGGSAAHRWPQEPESMSARIRFGAACIRGRVDPDTLWENRR